MNVKKSISPLKVNEYGSTKICNSESISPIKLWKNTKKSVLSAKDFSDVSSDSELSVISSVSSNSLSSHRRNNLQSDNIIYGKNFINRIDYFDKCWYTITFKITKPNNISTIKCILVIYNLNIFVS